MQVNASRQISARQSLLVGGDFYFESFTSEAFDVSPVTDAVSPRRPRVPDGATYHQSGIFAQTELYGKRSPRGLGSDARGLQPVPASAADAPVVDGKPLWPDDHLSTTERDVPRGC